MNIRSILLAALTPLLLGGCALGSAMEIDCPGFASHLRTLPVSDLRRDIEYGRPVPGSNSVTKSTAKSASEAGKSAEAQKYLDGLMSELRDSLDNKNFNPDAPNITPAAPGILVLSGGGQWGAYGAGFLKKQADTGTLPVYNLVTGVSTGGLQTLFAVAGRKEDYEDLLKAYTIGSENEIVRRGEYLDAAINGYLANLSPLRRRVENALCPDAAYNNDSKEKRIPDECLMSRIKNSPRLGLVGLVNARDGDFYYVNLRELFSHKNAGERTVEEARACITGAVLASAAMPGFFQQVKVDGRTYFDGGVRLSVFMEVIIKADKNAIRDQKKKAGSPREMNSGPARAYVLRNGPTFVSVDEKADGKRNIISSALRAEAILVSESEVGSIERLRLYNADTPMFLTTANRYSGQCVRSDTEAKKMFSPWFMKCLRKLGADDAEKTGWRLLSQSR